MTRLTDPLSDDDIDDLRRDNCHGSGDAYACAWEVHSMATELRARRAADLSAEDVEALRWLSTRPWLKTLAGTTHLGPPTKRALSVLDRILAAAGGGG